MFETKLPLFPKMMANKMKMKIMKKNLMKTSLPWDVQNKFAMV